MIATIKTSFVCFCAALSLATLTAQAAKLSAAEDIFQDTNLLRIAIEIEAELPSGFDDGIQRAVRENCDQLKFKNRAFED